MDSHTVAFIQAVRHDDTTVMLKELEGWGPGLVHAEVAAAATPLHIAAALNLTNAAALLLEWGADVDARTEGGFTPLHWAAGRNAGLTVDLLIRSGADLEAGTSHGITPLHWASSNNATNAVKRLLAAGAVVTARTEKGMTPLHWAVMREAGDAAVALTFKAVSDQMEAGSTGAPPSEVASPDSESALPPEPPAVPAGPRTPFGASLAVLLGFGETLDFVWIEPLKLWAGKYEVTNGQFRRFRPAHNSLFYEGFSLNGNDQPAVYVSWEDARDFCAWLNRQYANRIPVGCEFRLPTHLEWMAIASSGSRRTYPWGNGFPPRYGNFSDLTSRKAFLNWEGIKGYDDGYAVTCPVTASGAGEWGIYGLAGNVWEWCEDWHDDQRVFKVRHGGGWDFDGESGLRIESKGFDRPDARYDTIGIRLVVGKR